MNLIAHSTKNSIVYTYSSIYDNIWEIKHSIPTLPSPYIYNFSSANVTLAFLIFDTLLSGNPGQKENTSIDGWAFPSNDSHACRHGRTCGPYSTQVTHTADGIRKVFVYIGPYSPTIFLGYMAHGPGSMKDAERRSKITRVGTRAK